MASNSKKRRRVLGVSCILAALIIASSSFAWFTSRDEVTNRLSANADYDVSIVESFAPPENWLPGQKVNKDVYAVNTGNIPAYVRELVSGTLTVTREIDVDSGVTDKSDLNTLTKGERYVVEAGSFLALKPAGDTTNRLGEQIVSMVPSTTDLDKYEGDATSFTPAAEGLYVFRRSLEVNKDATATESADKFTYQAYYYDGTSKFYKVKLTSTTPDNPVDNPDLANDGVKTDGNLVGATYVFTKDQKEVKKPVALSYDSANTRLVATYEGQKSTVTDAQMTQLAQELDTAWHDYDKATEVLAKAAGDNTAAQAAIAAAHSEVVAKKNELDRLTKLRTDKQSEKDDIEAQITYWEGERTSRKSAKENSEATMYGAAGLTDITATGGLYKDWQDAITTRAGVPTNDAARTAFYTEFRAYVTSLVTGGNVTLPTGKQINDASNASTYIADEDLITLLTYTQVSNFTASSEAHTYYEKLIDELQKKNAYDAEKKLYDEQYTVDYTEACDKLGGETRPTNGTAPANSLYAKDDTLADELAILNGNATVDGSVAKAQQEYNDAVANETAAATVDPTTGAGTAAENYAAAKAAYDTAYANYYAKQSEYNTAYNSYTASTGDLKIFINLSDKVVTTATSNDQWQLVPNKVENDVAAFYYTGILGAGNTSSKLIDSVELDPAATQDMYKSFDFDLNVALDSAQIVYDADQKTILTTPAKENFSTSTTSGHTTTTTTVDATLGTATDLDTLVTWTSNTVNQTTTP